MSVQSKGMDRGGEVERLRELLAAAERERDEAVAELESERRWAAQYHAEAQAAEAVLREIAEFQHRYVQTGYASEYDNEDECGPCRARAFLARRGEK